MRIFLNSRTSRQGQYAPDELAVLDRICKMATMQLGLKERDDMDDLAAGILSLYAMGSREPAAILREILLVFSTERRLNGRGKPVPARRADWSRLPPKRRLFG